MTKLTMTAGQLGVLDYVGRVYGFAPDGALFWNGPRRANANRLVKRGLLERKEHPFSAGYAITEAGKSALSLEQGETKR